MARSSRAWWWVFGLCAAGAIGALAFVSHLALKLEAEALDATRHARRMDRVRTALWRLDSEVLPILVREGSRPYFEYLAYYAQERTYTRFLNPLEKGEVLVPSPLLAFGPEHSRLHFQIDSAGAFTSPQSPQGNLLDLCQATCSTVDDIPGYQSVLEEVRGRLDVAAVREALAEAERAETSLSLQWLEQEQGDDPQVRGQQAESADAADPAEWAARQKKAMKTRLGAKEGAELQNRIGDQEAQVEGSGLVVGSLVPMWIGREPELFFFRRVVIAGDVLLQGILLDWIGLKATLLAEIDGLVPGADLVPVRARRRDSEGADGLELATIPARLVVPPALLEGAAAVPTGFTAVRASLSMAWGAVLAALLGGAFALRSSMNLSERRARFASAVTHELRTPLTTFRMYSEMLADGMVADPAQRRVYRETLREQSSRLSTLVENVLAFARLEEGRSASRIGPLTVGELLERSHAALAERAKEAGLVLECECDPELAARSLTTDADAVAQILFNLVDNACKYARGGASSRLHCRVGSTGRSVEIALRDHGPGVPESMVRAIFRPFERGSRNGDPAPGVGLGLALARGLARDLRGDLRLDAPPGGGARFTLSLPLDR